MRNNILKDSNSLLGFMISAMDKDNNCDVYKIFNIVGNDKTLDIQNLIDELSAKGYVKQTNSTNIHIFANGVCSYISTPKSIWIKSKVVIAYFGGILTTVIAELIVWFIIRLLES